MNSVIRDNAAGRRLELDVDGQVVFATYERRDFAFVIRHVEAPPALRGTGAAGRLMQGIAELARTEGRTITPLCGYASAWLRRHKEYHDLLS
ncbi:GNAT family N-acetyltransferase [Microvirga roseola]|uniref:GNAT family N-acetyltransferase n=1 Tax=Microvirga roseola TaxID=2883126 RepID=UPI001E395E40|nr:GNAT family N-acetyltransferase [Microvirga roseola]